MKPIPVALLLSLSLAVPALAQKSEEPPLVWQSDNDTVNELTREFADLYRGILVLDTQGRKVPATITSMPAGKTLTEVLRERGLFAGKDLPRQLDVLTCRLNRDVCKVRLGASGDVSADDATANWRIKAGAPLRLPDIKFIELKLHKPYDKRAGDTLKTIVVDDRQGCEEYDAECRKYVQNLNRRVPEALDAAYAGTIVVPTKAYRAVIRVTRDEDDDSRADLLQMAPKLRDRIVPSAKASRHDTHDGATVPGSRAHLLKLIRHPLSSAPSITFPEGAKSNVVVIDNWADPGHCLLPNITLVNPDGLGSAVERAGACGDAGNAADATDHGTHVVGMIGMRLGGKHGPGVNPYATIRVMCVKYDEFANPQYLIKQADQLRALYRTDAPDVVNLSFEYRTSTEDGRADVFYNAIKSAERNTLFVVSAGNDAAELKTTSACEVLPACYGGKNIVTVGALDLDEAAPKMMVVPRGGSNFGDRVHLAAPGKDILSTLSGDRTGVMTGTSQAAPAVAGAASLLYLYEPRVQPAQVKNRLIYASDLFPDLFGKLQGGRLNVQRLLAYKTAQLQTVDGVLEGAIVDTQQKVGFTAFDGAGPLNIAWAQVRRLVFHPREGHYTLFYNNEVGRDTGNLTRRLVLLEDPDKSIAYRVTKDGAPDRNVTVTLKQIVDYVSELLI